MMENTKRQRGRPATGTARSDADRARKYRLRAVDSQDLENEQCTFNQLLMRLADLHKKESANYYLIRLVLDELTRRNEKNKPD